MSGMCGSGSSSVISSSTPTSTTATAPGGMARTGIPLGSIEIGNLGVSATPAVPTPAVSPIVGFVGPTPLAPTVPDDLSFRPPLRHGAHQHHRQHQDSPDDDYSRRLLKQRTQFRERAMRKKTVISAALLTAAFAAGGLMYVIYSHSFQKADAAPAPPTVPIVAATVAQHDVPIYLTGVGTVIAYNTVVVRSPDPGTDHQHQLHRRADRACRRPARADRSASLPGADRPVHRQPAIAIRRSSSNAQANLTRYTTLGSKGWATPQLVETQKAQVAQLQSADQGRRGAHRSREGATQLHAADVADRWRGRHSSDRRRQHHQPVDRERPRRRHAARADLADLHAAGNGPAANPAATAKDQGRRSRSLPTARTIRSSWIRASSASSTTRSCRPPARSSSRPIFPTSRIGSGRASSSTRGCWSIRGITA